MKCVFLGNDFLEFSMKLMFANGCMFIIQRLDALEVFFKIELQ